MATQSPHSWKETLTTCGLPLNCMLVFHLQNRCLNAVLLDGKPIYVPKQSTRVFAGLVEEHLYKFQGASGWLADAADLANPRRNEVTAVTINVHNGSPVEQKAAFRTKQYFERGDKAAHPERTADLGFSMEE